MTLFQKTPMASVTHHVPTGSPRQAANMRDKSPLYGAFRLVDGDDKWVGRGGRGSLMSGHVDLTVKSSCPPQALASPLCCPFLKGQHERGTTLRHARERQPSASPGGTYKFTHSWQ